MKFNLKFEPTGNPINPLDASPRTLYVVIFELPYASPRTAYVVVWNKKSENIPWAETFETSPAWRSKHVVKPVLPLIMCNVKLSRYEFLFEGVCCKTSFIVYLKKNENLFFCLSKFTEKNKLHRETLIRFALVRQQASLYQMTQRYDRVIFPVWAELSHFGTTTVFIWK